MARLYAPSHSADISWRSLEKQNLTQTEHISITYGKVAHMKKVIFQFLLM